MKQDVLVSATITVQVSKRVETNDPVEALRDFLTDLKVQYGNHVMIEHPQARDFLSRRALATSQATGIGRGRIVRVSRR